MRARLLALTSLLLIPVPCGAADPEAESLRGLSGVNVLVENLSDSAKRAGLEKNSIQTDVELKLRLAGIKVLTDEEWLYAPGDPYLYVNLTVVWAGGICAYGIDVELKQTALLDRVQTIRHLLVD